MPNRPSRPGAAKLPFRLVLRPKRRLLPERLIRNGHCTIRRLQQKPLVVPDERFGETEPVRNRRFTLQRGPVRELDFSINQTLECFVDRCPVAAQAVEQNRFLRLLIQAFLDPCEPGRTATPGQALAARYAGQRCPRRSGSVAESG